MDSQKLLSERESIFLKDVVSRRSTTPPGWLHTQGYIDSTMKSIEKKEQTVVERTGRDVRIDLGGVGEEWQVYMIKTRYIYKKFSMI